MLEQTIRDQIKTAMIQKDEISKNILRLVLGEIQLKNNPSENDIISIIRKVIKSNDETLQYKQDDIIVKENEILNNLLPSFISEDQIRAEISNAGLDLLDFKNEGQALGSVIKILKGKNMLFNPDLVKKVVQDLRA